MKYLNKIHLFILVFILGSFFAFGQNDTSKMILSNIKIINENYENAFASLKEMLEGKKELSFKKAVFVTENAYYDNSFDYKNFDAFIKDLALIAKTFNNSYKLVNYQAKDSINFLLNGAIFTLIKDTIRIVEGNDLGLHLPFNYDFEDFCGAKDWGKTFVFKLLSTRVVIVTHYPIYTKLRQMN